MSDVALNIVDDSFDIEIVDNDIAMDNGLETAITISLFTNKRVSEEEIPYGNTSKEGWWGDMYSDITQDKIGSRLWILYPGKTTTENLRRSEDFCKEALKWLIDDGISSAINVLSEYNESKHLLTKIEIEKFNGDNEKYSVIWDAQKIRRG